jgi:hypothetical protein
MVSNKMDSPWDQTEPLIQAPKVEPWMSFGVALVIAVIAVLFAAGTWVVRSGQTSRALERSAKAKQELLVSKDELTKIEQERARLETDGEVLRNEILAINSSRAELENEIVKLRAEFEATKRELQGNKTALADTRQRDADPSNLPDATLADLLKSKIVRPFVFVDDQERKARISEGALTEYLKQKSQMICGFSFDDSSKSWLVVSLIAATASDDRSSLSVSLDLRQPWKGPGSSAKRWVSVWQRHAVGMTTVENADSLVEALVEDLLKELAKEFET